MSSEEKKDSAFEIVVPAVVKIPTFKTEVETGEDGKEHIKQVPIEMDYTYEQFVDEFIFNNPDWATEEWAGAYERCVDLFAGESCKPGAVIRVQDSDKAKLGLSVSRSVALWCDPKSSMDPKIRKRLMRYAHVISTAKKAKDG